jgi:hypothetical protein
MNMKKVLPILVIASMMLSMIPSVIALPAPTLSAAAGVKGDTIKVTGPAGTVPAGTTLQLYWDTTTGAWDGTKGLMNSTTAKASGAYEVWFKVPEAKNGAHYVWIKDSDANTASAAFTVNTKVKNSPASGLPNDSVTGTFNGFAGSTDISAVLNAGAFVETIVGPLGVPPLDVPETLSAIDGVKTVYSGTFANKYIVPGSIIMGIGGVQEANDDGAGKLVDSGAGSYTVVTGTINYITGAYSIEFSTAPIVVVPGLRTDYHFWGASATQFQLAKGATNSVGTASVVWKVPATAVSPTLYNLYVIDGKGVSKATTFSVGPVITLTPATGAVGDVIAVSGRGFTPTTSTIVSIVLSRTGYTSACKISSDTPVTVDLNGRFRANIIVPGAPKVDDDYTLTVTSSDLIPLVATADFEVTALHTLTVNPVFGPQGSTMTVSGTHWAKVVDTVVTVELWSNDLVTKMASIGTAKTLSDGSFSKVFTVPAQIDDSYKVLAYYGTPAYTTKSTGFRIGTMILILSSSSGPTGKTITVSGSGFTKSGSWNASIGEEDLVTGGVVSAAGLISQTVKIPAGLTAKAYTVSVMDIDAEITLTATFTVTYATQITLDPSTASNLYNVSVTGKGFAYASTGITFILYNKTSTGIADYIFPMDVKQNWGAGPLPMTTYVNGTGFVTAYWVVQNQDTLDPGTYYVNATDADDYIAHATFTIPAKHVVVTPRKATFGVGDTMSFQLEHTWGKYAPQLNSVLKIYDPNGALVFSGDALATWVKTGLWYTAPYSSQTAAGNPMVLPDDAPLGTWTYKWVGTDNKNIATGSFTVTAAAPSPIQQQVIDLGKQITALQGTVTTAVQGAQTAATTAGTKADAATAAATAAGSKADAATAAATAAGTKADAAAAAANSAATAAKSAADAASGLTTLVYAAIGASLIAALAAIVALMQISRKIA